MSCSHPDCSYYPYYGVAPHECYWRKEGGFEANPLGTSTIEPLEKWPENFLAEIDLAADVELQLSWGLCGVFVCPTCGSGISEGGGLHGRDKIREALASKEVANG